MIRKYLLLISFLVGAIAACFSQVTTEEVIEFRSVPKQFTDTLQVMEIYIFSQKEVKKETKKSVKRTRKYYKRTKYPWKRPKLSKSVESYVIELKDSANNWYSVVSKKVETTSNEKITIGEKYEMELNVIRYRGVIAGLPISNIFLSGTYIPLPQSAQPFSIYISPNLEGLYYVK
jgi:hypothetical protein